MKKIARKVTGQVLSAEVAVTALLMIIFLCMTTDTFICVYGFSELDEAARDAARAAAATNDPLNAYTAAQQAALSHKTDGILVTQPTVSGPAPPAGMNSGANCPGHNWTTNPDFVYMVNPGSPSTPCSPSGAPYATVTTRCSIKMPVPINFFGDVYDRSGALAYGRTYTFPILGVPFSPSLTTPAAVTAPPSPAQLSSAATASSTAAAATAASASSAAAATAASATAAAASASAASTAAAARAATTAAYNAPSATAARAATAASAAATAAATRAATTAAYNAPSATAARAAAAATAAAAVPQPRPLLTTLRRPLPLAQRLLLQQLPPPPQPQRPLQQLPPLLPPPQQPLHRRTTRRLPLPLAQRPQLPPQLQLPQQLKLQHLQRQQPPPLPPQVVASEHAIHC